MTDQHHKRCLLRELAEDALHPDTARWLIAWAISMATLFALFLYWAR